MLKRVLDKRLAGNDIDEFDFLELRQSCQVRPPYTYAPFHSRHGFTLNFRRVKNRALGFGLVGQRTETVKSRVHPHDCLSSQSGDPALVAFRSQRVARHSGEDAHATPAGFHNSTQGTCMRDVKDKYTATRVHLLSAFLRAKDPIDKRQRSEFPQ